MSLIQFNNFGLMNEIVNFASAIMDYFDFRNLHFYYIKVIVLCAGSLN